LSEAVKEVMGTVRLLEVAGMVKPVMVGGVVSGIVIVTEAVRLVETLPAASLAHPYNVLAPAVAKV
jgi:hypothetical protein